MKTVRIISLWSDQRPPFTYTVIVPKETSTEAVLDEAFAETNRDDRPHSQEVPATTCGDILLLDGQHYVVRGIGYEPISDAEVDRLIALGQYDLLNHFTKSTGSYEPTRS